MKPEDPPPKFTKPGDNPELDALLAELRKDGEGGDPLFVRYRKHRKPVPFPAPSSGALPLPAAAAPAQPAQGAPSGAAPPIQVAAGATASGARPPSAARGAPVVRTDPRNYWIALAAFAILAPLATLGLGILLELVRGMSAATAPKEDAETGAAAPAASMRGEAVRGSSGAATREAPAASETVAPIGSAGARAPDGVGGGEAKAAASAPGPPSAATLPPLRPPAPRPRAPSDRPMRLPKVIE